MCDIPLLVEFRPIPHSEIDITNCNDDIIFQAEVEIQCMNMNAGEQVDYEEPVIDDLTAVTPDSVTKTYRNSNGLKLFKNIIDFHVHEAIFLYFMDINSSISQISNQYHIQIEKNPGKLMVNVILTNQMSHNLVITQKTLATDYEENEEFHTININDEYSATCTIDSNACTYITCVNEYHLH